MQEREFSRHAARTLAARLVYIVLATASGPASAQQEPTHRYRVAVDDSLSTLVVEARFAGPVDDLRARDRDAARFLTDATDCASGDTVPISRRRLQLADPGIVCLAYSVDLAAAAAGQSRRTRLSSRNVAASPTRWLWRPAGTAEVPIEVGFDLPDGIRVAVPWTPLDGDGTAFRIPPSPESASAPALFGDFEYREVRIAGARLRVALARGASPYDANPIVDWIRATAADVSLAYGRFPNPDVLVVVVPVTGESRWGRSPVPFGRVIRDGGEAVQLFVDISAPVDALLGDWTATHEFSHLMVPYLESRARWISEGFAQYYQNVLLARSGVYDEATAWQKIHAGLERGEAAGPDLSPNEAAGERRRGTRMKVYWSGAALALLADVELRVRTDGAQSLDAVLDRLQRCCLPSERVWSGPEFMARLDDIAGQSVLLPLYRRHADEPGFPDTAAVLADLGVITDTGLALDDDAPLAELRRAITRPDPARSAWRRSLLVAP